MKTHKHKAKREYVRPFFGAVSARNENRMAHGNVTVRAVCACGAIRETNVNGIHVERGRWQ